VGAQVLRELEGQSEVAAPENLAAMRDDDLAAAGKQGAGIEGLRRPGTASGAAGVLPTVACPSRRDASVFMSDRTSQRTH
jgi:hypothetical protein